MTINELKPKKKKTPVVIELGETLPEGQKQVTFVEQRLIPEPITLKINGAFSSTFTLNERKQRRANFIVEDADAFKVRQDTSTMINSFVSAYPNMVDLDKTVPVVVELGTNQMVLTFPKKKGVKVTTFSPTTGLFEQQFTTIEGVNEFLLSPTYREYEYEHTVYMRIWAFTEDNGKVRYGVYCMLNEITLKQE